jgi:putative PEP-CTERM system TPR-repeat lipoprotein
MQGKSEVAFATLQEIASSDEGVVADLALINAHMQRREVDKALAAIDSLEKKRANDPMPWQLRGRALLLNRDLAGARKAFEQAERMAPEYFAATAALAALDVAEGKASDAQRRLDETLRRNPKNAQALMAQAEILSRTGGAKEDIVGTIQKAVEATPNDKAPRLMLVDFHLRQNDPKAALAAAQAAVVTLPESPALFDALGRAQTASGEYNQALSSFGKLQGLLPQSPLPFLRMAMAQSASGDKSAAIASLRKALGVQPDLLEAQRGIAMLALQTNQPSEALAIGQSVQKQRPKEGVGYILEGDVQVASKKWDLAVNAYRAGLKAAPGSELAIKLHTALSLGGKGGDADRFATDWLKGNPKDATVLLYLGDRAIAAGKLKDAERLYERVVGLQPANAVALNNLAWVAGKLGRADAVALAEKANEVAPNQPAFMDTLAMLLSAAEEHARALDLQRKAMAMAPNTTLFKLNLAKIQIAAGERKAAQALLDEISALGDKFSGQSEVDALKREL